METSNQVSQDQSKQLEEAKVRNKLLLYWPSADYNQYFNLQLRCEGLQAMLESLSAANDCLEKQSSSLSKEIKVRNLNLPAVHIFSHMVTLSSSDSLCIRLTGQRVTLYACMCMTNLVLIKLIFCFTPDFSAKGG